MLSEELSHAIVLRTSSLYTLFACGSICTHCNPPIHLSDRSIATWRTLDQLFVERYQQSASCSSVISRVPPISCFIRFPPSGPWAGVISVMPS
jgi:hypothetical protein